MAVLAGKNPARVLIGYFGQGASNISSVTVNLHHLSALGQTTNRLKLNLYRIPNSGENDLVNPIFMGNWTVGVLNDTATIVLPSVNLHEEYVLALMPS